MESSLAHHHFSNWRATPSLGQWGVSSDAYGRLYRNSNEDPVRTELVPAHYTVRDSTALPVRGTYSALTANVPVFPSHKTPAVNRGYREKTLRADSTLAHYTSAGSPTAYVGDRYPDATRGSVFVTESAGNLVGQFVVTDSNGAPHSARRAQDSTDFLTSTDERFRPVNLANAPDGTLYVVDMYRGIIQHRTYITDYLEQKIRERGLEQPVGLGRIYRIVYDSAGVGPAPHMRALSAEQLVHTLTHASGWWRITAQRLLVEHGDTSIAPALRALQRHDDDRVRLHALWTLDGLGCIDTPSVMAALADASPHVRAAAIRVAEPWIRNDLRIRRAVSGLVRDSAVSVRRQLAASLAALPTADRAALARLLLTTNGGDAVIAEFAARNVAAAPAMLAMLLDRPALAGQYDHAAVEALGAQIGRASTPLSMQRAIALATDARRPTAQRLAIIGGLTRGARDARQETALLSPPTALLAMAALQDSALSVSAKGLAARLRWMGKRAESPVRVLTAAESARIAAGRVEFATTCAACHQSNGAGVQGAAASLVGSAYVTGPPARLIRIVLQGKEGNMLMPPIGATLSDERLASILSFIRREWGNTADPIDAAEVKDVRGATNGRQRAWTVDELARIR